MKLLKAVVAIPYVLVASLLSRLALRKGNKKGLDPQQNRKEVAK